MANRKDSFNFYRDWKAVFDQLPNEKAGLLIKHLLAYVNGENPVTDDLLINAVFAGMAVHLKKDQRRFEESSKEKSISGDLGNLKRWHPDLYDQVQKKKIHIEAAKKIARDRKNPAPAEVKNPAPKKVALSLEERTLQFKKRIIAEQSEKFDIELLKDFFIYWSEHGEQDKKMRWEKERTFGIKARLHTFWKFREQRKTKKDRL